MMFSFSIDAANSVCNQKALNRRARNYAEIVSEGRTVDKGLLIESLQFLSDEAFKVPMIAVLENESIFLGLCEKASVIDGLSGFVNTCKEVFSEVEPLKKVQVSMLLSTMLRLLPYQKLSEISGMERLACPSTSCLLEPVD